MTVAEGGGIFVSYRRQESSHLAGRLSDRLADRFGEGQVFIDVDTIEPGVDFAEEVARAVGACKVLLAVIGPDWLTVTDQRGRRRLDDPDDIVRMEIEAALARDVRVIPILVEGAVMPGRDDLPASLAGLARRNALFVRYESFHSDAGRLVRAVERALAAPSAAAVPRAPGAHSARSGGNVLAEVAHQGRGPAQNDLARAARLLSDAERIARSVRDKGWQGQALGAVAETLAATDPDHAELIAHSIRDTVSKVSALGAIATVLAATNPYRATQLLIDAERIARSVRDKALKERALCAIAKALAVGDPDRAEGIARSITDELWEAAALGGITEALAASDPDRAEGIARSITSEYNKASALSAVAEALTATDPDRGARLLTDAEHIAYSITSPYWKPIQLSAVAEALAASDPDRAEGIARSIASEYNKASALSAVAEALTATDPDRGARLLTDAERIAYSITSEYDKASALGAVAKALAATDPDRAELIARSITGTHKGYQLVAVAEALAASDPDRAEGIARSITEKWRKATALSSIAKALTHTSS